jgi:hypothetical protein
LLLTALVLFCCNTISGDSPRIPVAPPTGEIKSAAISERVSEVRSAKPDAPMPKRASISNSESDFELGAGAEPASAPAIQPILKAPVKPAITESYETPRQRKIWYGLMAAGHGAAAFDAWTTRRAISGNYGVEGDPLERPFAHNGAIYATTQVTPILMDYLGRRMMRSNHPLLRKAWWVPQAASASVSFSAGIHNYNVVP